MATTAKISITLDRSKMLNFNSSMYGPEFLERILEAVRAVVPDIYQLQANFGSDLATVEVLTTEDVEEFPNITEIYSVIKQTFKEWNHAVRQIDEEKLEKFPFQKGQILKKTEEHRGEGEANDRFIVTHVHYDNDGFVVYEIEKIDHDGKSISDSLEKVSLEHLEEIFTAAE
ncbi:hypothetical protein [Bombella saccharophila]|uniref:Uncharacterized protein n=1 Tax=Bombella saccharophila TaxID=2967338 RepID=A0ABT3W4Y3_9PROT|nr:hypothetical protein [Bombella saccharophila]MCX5613788.1 hypothetical protein [Bombella saccharophila]PHI97460.1 hypothetical protein BG621_01440 [Parasaccharibacter apium]